MSDYLFQPGRERPRPGGPGESVFRSHAPGSRRPESREGVSAPQNAERTPKNQRAEDAAALIFNLLGGTGVAPSLRQAGDGEPIHESQQQRVNTDLPRIHPPRRLETATSQAQRRDSPYSGSETHFETEEPIVFNKKKALGHEVLKFVAGTSRRRLATAGIGMAGLGLFIAPNLTDGLGDSAGGLSAERGLLASPLSAFGRQESQPSSVGEICSPDVIATTDVAATTPVYWRVNMFSPNEDGEKDRAAVPGKFYIAPENAQIPGDAGFITAEAIGMKLSKEAFVDEETLANLTEKDKVERYPLISMVNRMDLQICEDGTADAAIMQRESGNGKKVTFIIDESKFEIIATNPDEGFRDAPDDIRNNYEAIQFNETDSGFFPEGEIKRLNEAIVLPGDEATTDPRNPVLMNNFRAGVIDGMYQDCGPEIRDVIMGYVETELATRAEERGYEDVNFEWSGKKFKSPADIYINNALGVPALYESEDFLIDRGEMEKSLKCSNVNAAYEENPS